MEAFVDRSSDSMVIAMPPKAASETLWRFDLKLGLIALGLSREAMELVTGGDLLSSLTGEPQHYEDTSNIQAVVPMSDRFSLFNYLPDMPEGKGYSTRGAFLVICLQVRSPTWLLQKHPLIRVLLVAPPPLSGTIATIITSTSTSTSAARQRQQ